MSNTRSYMKFVSAKTAKLTVEMIRDQLEWLSDWESTHTSRIALNLRLIDQGLDDIDYLLDLCEQQEDADFRGDLLADMEQEAQTRSVQDESGMAGEAS